MAIRRVVATENRTTFRKKEMCHEEIHRRARGDCKRGPRVPVELLVRQQRLLTISWASERFCSRPGIREGGRLARASRPSSRYKINLADKALVFAAVPVDEPHHWRGWMYE